MTRKDETTLGYFVVVTADGCDLAVLADCDFVAPLICSSCAGGILYYKHINITV